ncbi:hypothetical protein [Leptolyngbya sp. FACHB-17]|uniref:hypothetical protein n=1 Tax=unclassified Leptolyngbya TaxID=2650499 RepID=UPI00198C0F00|nr:hypothetical protein [Leptolyngbya sp. FACHB-17]MBD2078717.1 hypothetical protein [Leptolyngbya sp. FACHB-17]
MRNTISVVMRDRAFISKLLIQVWQVLKQTIALFILNGEHSGFDRVPHLRRHSQGGFFAANHQLIGIEIVVDESISSADRLSHLRSKLRASYQACLHRSSKA